MNNEKTNVMRLLEQKKIPYTAIYYEGGALSGAEVARATGQDPKAVYKTLVTVGAAGQHYVFVVPVEAELNLKAAAKAAGEKSVRMLAQKELLPLTGYVHGGCSPIGMKKPFPTFVDESARGREAICFSAGKIGAQVKCDPESIGRFVKMAYAEIAQAEGV